MTTKKQKLALSTSQTEAWKPTAAEPSQPRAAVKPRRRYPGKSPPTPHVAAGMDPAHYGPCCVRADGVRGMKRWGDGKGSNVFKGETTYFCHMCVPVRVESS